VPKTLPSGMILEKNKLATPNPWVILLDIILKEDGVTQQTFRFTNNNENLTYNSNTYEAFPFTIQPTKQSTQGEIPTITLAVANVTQVIQQWIEQLEGGVGSQVTVYVVMVDAATKAVTGDAELEYTFDIVGTESTAEWLLFTLGASNPMRKDVPPHRYVANHCNWEFKGPECAYNGAATECERTWDDCKNLGNSHRFGGFPGLSPTGVRIA
jgi:lambda family phage minor tail protein L